MRKINISYRQTQKMKHQRQTEDDICYIVIILGILYFIGRIVFGLM